MFSPSNFGQLFHDPIQAGISSNNMLFAAAVAAAQLKAKGSMANFQPTASTSSSFKIDDILNNKNQVKNQKKDENSNHSSMNNNFQHLSSFSSSHSSSRPPSSSSSLSNSPNSSSYSTNHNNGFNMMSFENLIGLKNDLFNASNMSQFTFPPPPPPLPPKLLPSNLGSTALTPNANFQFNEFLNSKFYLNELNKQMEAINEKNQIRRVDEEDDEEEIDVVKSTETFIKSDQKVNNINPSKKNKNEKIKAIKEKQVSSEKKNINKKKKVKKVHNACATCAGNCADIANCKIFRHNLSEKNILFDYYYLFSD
jgi:hypothetical protein